MSWFEALSFPFMQHALLGVLLGGLAFPLIGVFIICLNLIPLRFAMMHVALLGGAVGLFVKVDPMMMGLLFCGLTSLALGPVSEKMSLGVGTLSGYSMTLTLALALILFSRGDIHVLQAFDILWGNVLSLTRNDLLVLGGLAVGVCGFVVLFFKEILAILYDREIASAVGLPEKRFHSLIVFILGLSVAVSMRLIGALLIDAFVLVPAMASMLIARSLKQMFVFSSLFGAISGVSGLYFAFAFDIPASAAIVLSGSLMIVIGLLLRKRFVLTQPTWRGRAPG